MGDVSFSRVLRALFGGKAAADGKDATREGAAGSGVFAGDPKALGTVFVLGLGEFYDALGGRSGRLAESVQLICESVLTDRVGPGGVFICPDDAHLLFRFDDMARAGVRRRAAEIVGRIGTKLLGEHYLRSGQFRAALAMVEMERILDEDGRVSPRRMAAALSATRKHGGALVASGDPSWGAFRFADLTGDTKWRRSDPAGDAPEAGPLWEAPRHGGNVADPAAQWLPDATVAAAAPKPETPRADSRRDRRLASEAATGPAAEASTRARSGRKA